MHSYTVAANAHKRHAATENSLLIHQLTWKKSPHMRTNTSTQRFHSHFRLPWSDCPLYLQTIFVLPVSCTWFVLARIYIYIVNRVHCISNQCLQCMEKDLNKAFSPSHFFCGGHCPACTRVSFLDNFCFIFILLSLPYLSALLFFSLISFSISPPSPPVCRLTACLPT